MGQELYDVVWQRFPAGVFTAQPIVANQKIEGIKSSQPLASTEPYRPPGARGIIIPPLSTTGASKTTGSSPYQKNRKRPTNQFRNKHVVDPASVSAPELSNGAVPSATPTGNGATATKKPLSPQELEKIKRVKVVNKKLSDISKLKSRKEKGEHLETNQLAKITSEADLLKELKELKVTA